MSVTVGPFQESNARGRRYAHKAGTSAWLFPPTFGWFVSRCHTAHYLPLMPITEAEVSRIDGFESSPRNTRLQMQ